MELNWTIIGILAFCAILIIIYFLRRNRKDRKEMEKFFNDGIKRKKDIELSDDDEF